MREAVADRSHIRATQRIFVSGGETGLGANIFDVLVKNGRTWTVLKGAAGAVAVPDSCTCVVLVVPQTESRVQELRETLAAAASAGAASVVLVSQGNTKVKHLQKTSAGEDGDAIEELVRASGLRHVVLRVPALLNEDWARHFGALAAGRLECCVPQEAPMVSLSSADIAKAVLAVAVEPHKHIHMTYVLSGVPYTGEELMQYWSAALGSAVQYTHIKEDEAAARLVAGGLEAWQAKEVVESYKMAALEKAWLEGAAEPAEEETPVAQTPRSARVASRAVVVVGKVLVSTDFFFITGRDPRSMQRWVKAHVAEVQGTKKEEVLPAAVIEQETTPPHSPVVAKAALVTPPKNKKRTSVNALVAKFQQLEALSPSSLEKHANTPSSSPESANAARLLAAVAKAMEELAAVQQRRAVVDRQIEELAVTCTHTHTHTHTHDINTYTHTHKHKHTHKRTHIHMHTYICTHIYIQTHIQTYTHTHTHTSGN
jgi:hypothetical protein